MLDKLMTLMPEAKAVILDKATQPPFSGQYNAVASSGTYLCRRCGHALFRADSQFSSSCGWPSFDVDVPQAVIHQLDADGQRHEILCAQCGAHLGHVFHGEGFTDKNTRYCVNDLSLDFVDDEEVMVTEEAMVAGGCFWGVQALMDALHGVLSTEVGFAGGDTDYPSYEQVCQHATGHLEVLRIVYDPKKISYESIIKYFFEIHDPAQSDGQGPDRGDQYRSAIFYYDDVQLSIAKRLIAYLSDQGMSVVTQTLPACVFWPAELSHQHYYQKNQQQPYCHRHTKRF